MPHSRETGGNTLYLIFSMQEAEGKLCCRVKRFGFGFAPQKQSERFSKRTDAGDGRR